MNFAILVPSFIERNSIGMTLAERYLYLCSYVFNVPFVTSAYHPSIPGGKLIMRKPIAKLFVRARIGNRCRVW